MDWVTRSGTHRKEACVRPLIRSFPISLVYRHADLLGIFVLLICVLFHPSDAAGQIRCQIPVGNLVSVEGEVSVAAAAVISVAAALDTRVCPGDFVVVGPRSRAAICLEDTGQGIRLDPGSTLRVLPP